MVILLILCLIGGTTILMGAVLYAPHWLGNDLVKDRIWRTRDRIYDATRSGTLPAAHPAVISLISYADLSATSSSLPPSLGITLLAARQARQRHSPAPLLILPPSDDLSLPVLAELDSLNNELTHLLVLSTLVSSWAGLLFGLFCRYDTDRAMTRLPALGLGIAAILVWTPILEHLDQTYSSLPFQDD